MAEFILEIFFINSLCSCLIPGIPNKHIYFLKKSSNLGAMVYSIDDVKFQPKTAQATCYVYDVATFKTLAQFDDQHFALLYQYDLRHPRPWRI